MRAKGIPCTVLKPLTRWKTESFYRSIVDIVSFNTCFEQIKHFFLIKINQLSWNSIRKQSKMRFKKWGSPKFSLYSTVLLSAHQAYLVISYVIGTSAVAQDWAGSEPWLILSCFSWQGLKISLILQLFIHFKLQSSSNPLQC